MSAITSDARHTGASVASADGHTPFLHALPTSLSAGAQPAHASTTLHETTIRQPLSFSFTVPPTLRSARLSVVGCERDCRFLACGRQHALGDHEPSRTQ